jgi:hypothetical protein
MHEAAECSHYMIEVREELKDGSSGKGGEEEKVLST